MMNDGDYDTLISTTDVQIECMYENKPLNFKQKEKTPPSQSLTPVKAYACGLMAWKSEKFKENMLQSITLDITVVVGKQGFTHFLDLQQLILTRWMTFPRRANHG